MNTAAHLIAGMLGGLIVALVVLLVRTFVLFRKSS